MKSGIVYSKICITLSLVFSSVMALAQPGNPGTSPDPGVPIDLGLTAFIAAGVGYAVKKRMDKKKTDLNRKHLDK